MITYPQPDLARMFGSTHVVQSRSFAFRPVFGCGVIRPSTLTADVELLDSAGTRRMVTASADF
jgi:hypothetical protein